jgi:GMP synthase (glutamine-hydrolysing)
VGPAGGWRPRYPGGVDGTRNAGAASAAAAGIGGDMTGRPVLLVVEHEEDAPPALLAEVAAAAGVELRVARPYAGDQLPDDLDAAGLVVLGGEMGVGDAASWPHLHPTMALIRHAAERAAPVLGVCLGAQLAAAALGGRAYPGPAGLEVGWVEVELTPEGRDDPVVGALRDGDPGAPAVVFQWHKDTYDPPPGARLLASGDRYHQQAFRLGSVVGVQFHPEVDEPTISAWYAMATAPPPYPEADSLAGLAAATPSARRLLDAFCRRLPRRQGN